MTLPPAFPKLSPIERYPNLNLQPFDNALIVKFLIAGVCSRMILFSILPFALGSICYIEYCNSGHLHKPLPSLVILATTVILAVISIITGIKRIRNNLSFKGKGILLSYIKTNSNYAIYVQDNLFGLLSLSALSMQFKIIIPAQYDYLEWYQKGKMLRATRQGRNLIIDTHGNEL